jgi:hypothetical protein
MPPAIAVAIASLVATAGAASYEGYENAQAPGQQAQASSNAQQAAAQQAAQQSYLQKQQGINAQVANADQQTGGSLTDPGLTNLTSLLAGYGGQSAGQPASGTPGLQSLTQLNPGGSGPGLQDALSSLTSGGAPSSPSTAFAGGS